jgi:PKD repeat protein
MYTNKFHMNEAANRATHNKFFPALPAILSVILIFTAISCGGGGGSAPSVVPVANPGGPYLGNVNQALGFSGSGSAPSGRTIVSFAWQFGDGGTGTGATTAHTYKTAGNFTATLTVTDSSGATGSNNVAVQIITAPVAIPGGPYTGVVGTAVSFNGSLSTAPPGSALGFSWQFGDGATGSGATPTHTYSSACTCTVTLTVTDDTAGVSSATTTATITASSGTSTKSATPSTFFAIGPAANASSQFAYVLSPLQSGGSSLTIETIDDSTGALTPTGITPPPLDANFAAAGMLTDPSHKFLYLYGGNSVLSFSIASSSGALIPSGATSINGSANGDEILIFNPSGKFAYFVTQDPNTADPTAPGSITRFSVDPNSGTLGTIETVSAQISRPQSSAIDPSGRFLYISGFGSGASSDASAAAPRISALSIAPGTGALNPISSSPFAIESGIAATSIAIDPTGRFLFGAGRNSTTNSATLSVFTINAGTGAFSQSSSLALGDAIADATSLALSPSSNFGYVLTTFARTDATVHQLVQLFHWDLQTGTPAMGNYSIQYEDVADESAFRVGNLTLFSPTQVDGANSTGSIFIFVVALSDPSIFGHKLNPNTGSSASIAAQSNFAGH